MHSNQETGFLLNLSSVTQYCRKNPVSEILWTSVPALREFDRSLLLFVKFWETYLQNFKHRAIVKRFET
jgi:hypothetical protein